MQNARLKSETIIDLKPDFDFNYGTQKSSTANIKSSNEINHFDRTNISPDAIIFTNDKGQIKYINSEAQNLTGWFITDAMNTKISEVFNIYDLESEEKLSNPVDKVLVTNSKIDLTTKIILLSKDRLKFEIEYKATPKYSQDGKLNKIILTFKKIREIKNSQPEKKAVSTELKSRFDIKKEIIPELDTTGNVQKSVKSNDLTKGNKEVYSIS
ncbi:MAG: PAS domain-containing protein, partial [Thermodesulfobacteriota bacterium]